jgi:hypothetical protein
MLSYILKQTKSLRNTYTLIITIPLSESNQRSSDYKARFGGENCQIWLNKVFNMTYSCNKLHFITYLHNIELGSRWCRLHSYLQRIRHMLTRRCASELFAFPDSVPARNQKITHTSFHRLTMRCLL